MCLNWKEDFELMLTKFRSISTCLNAATVYVRVEMTYRDRKMRKFNTGQCVDAKRRWGNRQG